MSEHLAAIEARTEVERRRALRRLLAAPLLLAERDPESFALVLRHREFLARWFAEQVGWALTVEPRDGYARLHKRPARRDASRPARPRGRGDFDRRRYALFCLALAALDDGSGQTTLARLVVGVRDLSLEDPAIRPFEPDLLAERSAFVDALRLLSELGVISFRDGDAEEYARRREADALYDVHERILGQLLAAPVPPTLAGSPERMAEEEAASTEEGARARARQAVFRRLLDDPVVYLDDLDPASREWLEFGRGHLYERLESDAGLRVERRLEGLAAVDPEGELTDTAFPDGNSTVKHAALLLCEWLTDRARLARGVPVSRAELASRVEALREEFGGSWSKEYADGTAGGERLAADALALLAAFGLAAPAGEGWVALPAAARFAPAPAAPRT